MEVVRAYIAAIRRGNDEATVLACQYPHAKRLTASAQLADPALIADQLQVVDDKHLAPSGFVFSVHYPPSTRFPNETNRPLADSGLFVGVEMEADGHWYVTKILSFSST